MVLQLALVAFVGAFSARADQLTVVPGFGPYQVGSGGEFTVVPDAALAAQVGAYSPFAMNYVTNGSFQTFCVERNELITGGTTYDVTPNTITVFSGKPLTIGAAYLYQQFALGTLAGYNYADFPATGRTLGAHGSAYELQHALWYYMSEYSYDPYNIYMNGDVTLPANLFTADSGSYGVKILNLWTPGQLHDPAHTYQDVLVYLKPVPEPATFALAALGAAALMVCRRKK